MMKLRKEFMSQSEPRTEVRRQFNFQNEDDYDEEEIFDAEDEEFNDVIDE
jgi:hypothetical protein